MVERIKRPSGRAAQIDVSRLDFSRLPRHVAIIMDGNGRWAQKRGLPRSLGHREGVKTVHKIVRIASDLGVEALTLYAFSTENWKKRPEKEVGILMDLLVEFLTNELEELHNNGAKLNILGDYERLPERVVQAVRAAVIKTQANQGLLVNIALNYGGRSELVRAVKTIAAQVKEGKIQIDDINEETLSQALYTKGIADPDLVVRTSGEERLSNFLLYQAAYAELYFTPLHWPDFSEQDFVDMLVEYQSRNRRFGGL
ncbi:MAG: isoprenyl transferase [Bacillota bacterium]